MSKFEISLSKNDLEHIANGYDIKIKIDGKRFSNTNEIILKPALINDVMAPILNYKNKIIDTEQQNIVNNFIGGSRMTPKFRAWHNELSRMMLVKTMFFFAGGLEELELNDSVMNDYITAYPDEIELMQSTGLFDKKGVEIFEGDILKSNKYITSVFYERGAYCVKFCRTTNTTVTMNAISFIEKYKTKVIGNIYENPELLEDCK